MARVVPASALLLAFWVSKDFDENKIENCIIDACNRVNGSMHSACSVHHGDAPGAFWQRFSHTAVSHTAVFKLILDHLQDGPNTLRAVNTVLRCAVNRTVTTVRCAQHNHHPANDLVDIFPEADQLVCSFKDPLDSDAPAPIEHASLALDCLVASSPRFVGKLRVLKLHFHQKHINEIDALLPDLMNG